MTDDCSLLDRPSRCALIEQVGEQPAHVVGLLVDDPGELEHLGRVEPGQACSRVVVESMMEVGGARSRGMARRPLN